jgi:hypothetical protein
LQGRLLTWTYTITQSTPTSPTHPNIHHPSQPRDAPGHLAKVVPPSHRVPCSPTTHAVYPHRAPASPPPRRSPPSSKVDLGNRSLPPQRASSRTLLGHHVRTSSVECSSRGSGRGARPAQKGGGVRQTRSTRHTLPAEAGRRDWNPRTGKTNCVRDITRAP